MIIVNLEKYLIYIFGVSYVGILVEEMYYCVGGMMMINVIFGWELMLDCSFIIFISKMEWLEGYGIVLVEI